MWVRSQNKEILRDAVDFGILELKDHWGIFAGCASCSGNQIGSYSTKEKALKVLDMIETAIVEYDLGVYIVFQMPKDNEV